MKKTLRYIYLLAIIAIILITLTACGGDKLVATKTSEAEGAISKETWEISFKNNEPTEIKAIFEFDDPEMATAYYEAAEMIMPEASNVTKDGNKLSFTVSPESFEDFGDAISGKTKDDIKKQLEADGYTVK